MRIVTASRRVTLIASKSRKVLTRVRVTALATAVVTSSVLLLTTAADGEVITANATELHIGQHAFTHLADIPPFLIPEGVYDLDPNSHRNAAGADDSTQPVEDWCTRLVDNEHNSDPDKDVDDTFPCREWAITVQEPDAYRLRVAVEVRDLPKHHLFVELWRPNGEPVKTIHSPEQVYAETAERRSLMTPVNVEYTVYDPEPGTWILRVIPIEAKGELRHVRARAALEAVPTTQEETLTPNLRPVTPSFLEIDSAFPHPHCQPGWDTPPPPNTRCLRFQFGFQNVGLGPLELDFAPVPNTEGKYAVTQKIFEGPDATPSYTDNRVVETQEAGTATYHQAHGHFHYDHITTAQLFRVTDADTLVATHYSVKRGSCAHDGVAASFKTFRDVQWQADSQDDCRTIGSDPEGMRIGLSAGWADVYAASLPDNYVPFPLTGDTEGEWVLRTLIDHAEGDPDGHIKELNESDNVGYTHFSFDETTDKAVVLERGRGTDPWDPNKTVINDSSQ